MRQCRVREKPGLESYLTQFILTAAESGERKSAVHGHLVRPVDLTEREWAQEDQKALAAHEAKIAETREEATVKKRTAALKDTSAEAKKALLKEYGDLIRKAKELERDPPTVRQVYLDDTTEAAFASNLKRAGGALSVVSPEGRGFVATLLGYYANKQAKDAVYLQAYSGDTIKVARKTGGADGGELLTTIYDPASSFALMVQGDVVEELNRHIMLERSGFSNRVTYVRTTPMAGRRVELEDEQPFDEGVRKAWDSLAMNLLKHKDEDAPPIMLVLDEDAQAHRRTFHNMLEARLAGDLADHAGLVSKWTTKTSKLAALFALIEECAESPLSRLLEGEDKQKRKSLDVTGEHWLAAESVSEWLLRSTIGVRDLSGGAARGAGREAGARAAAEARGHVVLPARGSSAVAPEERHQGRAGAGGAGCAARDGCGRAPRRAQCWLPPVLREPLPAGGVNRLRTVDAPGYLSTVQPQPLPLDLPAATVCHTVRKRFVNRKIEKKMAINIVFPSLST